MSAPTRTVHLFDFLQVPISYRSGNRAVPRYQTEEDRVFSATFPWKHLDFLTKDFLFRIKQRLFLTEEKTHMSLTIEFSSAEPQELKALFAEDTPLPTFRSLGREKIEL